MKSLVRFCCLVGLLGVVVMPLSATPRDAGQVRLRNHGAHVHFRESGLRKSMDCNIDCGNGDLAYGRVATPEDCLALCEAYCGTVCD
jgi:hypothetical protein